MMKRCPSRRARSVTVLTMPTTLTCCPCISSLSWSSETTDPPVLAAVKAISGLCDNATPSSSRSQVAFSSGDASPVPRMTPGSSTAAPPVPALVAPGPPPKRLLWPLLRICASRCAVATIRSRADSTAPRGATASKAPALTMFSMVRRFRLAAPARRQKSSMDWKEPFSFRSSTSGLTAPSPTVLMAARPMRRPGLPSSSWSMVKNSPERFTSGSQTGMPSRKHSLMELMVLSLLSRLAFSTAAMYSTG